MRKIYREPMGLAALDWRQALDFAISIFPNKPGFTFNQTFTYVPLNRLDTGAWDQALDFAIFILRVVRYFEFSELQRDVQEVVR